MMGKSTASCFKIVGCAGESVDHSGIRTPESKGSSDRRRWTFRKRSPRHRVLSNSVSSEAPSSLNKENPESPAVSFSPQIDLTVPKKLSVIQSTEENTEFIPNINSELLETLSAVEDDFQKRVTLDEPSIIIIQAAIRRWLAQHMLLKLKNVVKLQAAVRGHIVRRHAVGTLRCVQSIIKMQALVRARRAALRDNNGPSHPALLEKNEAKPTTTHTYVSIKKLLSNSFARQLMESTPRNKPINIKCDPSKSDSSWKWFERWMSASSVSSCGTESPDSESIEETRGENLAHPDGQESILFPSDCCVDPKEAKFTSADKLNPTTEATESVLVEMKETDFFEVIDVKSLSSKDEKTGYVQTEAEAKELSRKASPSKFEESAFEKSIPSSSPHLGVETGHDKEKFSHTLESTGNKAPDNAAVSAATSAALIGSDCGTEISVSSTLDSPDRSEMEPDKIKRKKNKSAESYSSSRNGMPSSADKNHKPSSLDDNRNQDSGSRIVLERLRGTKAGKRRSSFGLGSKPDHKEHEPRDSSSSNSLPSYMQATESAMAKVITNGSSRSSPDVHHKGIYVKKRRSLPGTNEEEGSSPRIQRSLSQAQQKTKGTATHSPQDRRWRR